MAEVWDVYTVIRSSSYLIAGVCLVLALKWMTSPDTARKGNWAGIAGMVIAVAGTLVNPEIWGDATTPAEVLRRYQWIIIGLFVGLAIGAPMAIFMPMTAMPQRIALSHAFGALAAALVGTSEFYLAQAEGVVLAPMTSVPLMLEVVLGFLTFTGSLMAFGKLQEILPGRPITYRGQNMVNFAVLGGAIVLAAVLAVNPSLGLTYWYLFPLLALLAMLFGIFLVIPIGGADMPTVISLLNSYAGISGAAMGFVLDNKVLIIAGALDGSSGFILSVIMCRAMNRSFSNVLFGAFGAVAPGAKAVIEERPVQRGSPEEAAVLLAAAKSVIICPGYGMAVAQAQHAVKDMADALDHKGVDVKYAIHPVAGRMPGHMNVLLADAKVPYDELWEMERINPLFNDCDVAVVIGANDVTNPAAKTRKDSPLYGMPVLDVDKARSVIFIKRSMGSGFAGIDNDLFYMQNTLMVFGDAKKVATDISGELRKH